MITCDLPTVRLSAELLWILTEVQQVMYMFLQTFTRHSSSKFIHLLLLVFFSWISLVEVLARGICAVNKLFQVNYTSFLNNLEYFDVMVKLDLLCFHCKDLVFNGGAECKSIYRVLCQECAGASWMFSIISYLEGLVSLCSANVGDSQRILSAFSKIAVKWISWLFILLFSAPADYLLDRIHCLCVDPGGSFCIVHIATLLPNEFWPFKPHNCHNNIIVHTWRWTF